VKTYIDTNVLIAACLEEHPHHSQSFELLTKVRNSTLQGCISSHTLAEFYSVLTRAPFSPRVHPAEAGRLLEDNILPHFELVALSPDDYKTVLASCAKAGWIGGVVYDALHLHCAQKAGCQRIYTFNVKDFRALAPSGLQDKITAP
jgi:predicted nucleic acid-binding protein